MIDNLRPREPFRGQTKKRRNISLTDTAWESWEEIAAILDCSRQEAIEKIGRRELSPEEFKKLCEYLLTPPI